MVSFFYFWLVQYIEYKEEALVSIEVEKVFGMKSVVQEVHFNGKVGECFWICYFFYFILFAY